MSGSVEPVDRSRLLLCSMNIENFPLKSLKAVNYMTLVNLLFTFRLGCGRNRWASIQEK